MKYIKLFEELFSDNSNKKLSLNDTLNHYLAYGDLEGISIPKFESKKEDWLFNQIIELIHELKNNRIVTDDYTNTDNWGLKPNGDLAMFDLGFGNYFEEFDESPESLELHENNTLLNKILNKLNIPSSTFVGKGMFGFAHDIGNNRILKITKDKTEAINSSKIIGKTMTHIADIYDVKQFTSNDITYYVIILEKLKLGSTLDSVYQDLKETFDSARNKNLPMIIIDQIEINHKDVAGFLRDLIKKGHKETWDIWRDELENKGLYDVYDFNDIYDLSQWITGSVTNHHEIDDEPPHYIMDTLKTLL
jgi:hypothetical protein